MLSQIAPRHTSASLWSSLESAVRLSLHSLSAPGAAPSAFEELEGEKSRIRRTGRHWLIG